MQDVQHAFEEVKQIYEKLLGTPAPDVKSEDYVAFPPGVDPVRYAVEEARQLTTLAERWSHAPRPVSWIPPADYYATEDGYAVLLEVAGIRREDLKVEIGGGQCVVRGQRRPSQAGPGMRPLGMERAAGPFERRFALPPGTDPDKVTAQCRDGLLELRFTAEKGRKSENTEIQVA